MEKSTIIDRIQQYFRQQQEQYGDILFLEDQPLKIRSGEETTLKKEKKHRAAKEKFHFNPLSSPEHAPDLFTEEPEWKKAKTLDELYDRIHACTNCPLGETRNKFVFGTGNPDADIMVIGEAPGRDEDAQGLPFVGRAGQLLTKILESINLKREDVFIGNIIKCRPPDNRSPLPAEVDACEPYLMKQIELIKPAFILALGLTAIDTLLKSKHKMAETRGKILDYYGIRMLVTYHPAALLRNPNFKKPLWEDVKKLRRLYDEFLEGK